MKRILILATVFLLLLFTAGSAAETDPAPRGYVHGEGFQYYFIGEYPQEKDGEIEPLLWRALYLEDNQLLLITEYVIDVQQVIFESDPKIIKAHSYRRIETFTQSDLYVWMNTVMLDEMLGESAIRNALVEGENGLLYPLTDEQFLRTDYGFSSARFGVVKVRKAYPTDYAIKQGLYKDANGASPYWVATIKGADGYMLQIVGYDGHLSYGAYTRVNIGLRPSIMLDMTMVSITGGEGTKDDPFQIAYTGESTAE